MPARKSAGLAALIALLGVTIVAACLAGAAAAATGTPYRIVSVAAVETITLKGQGTVAGAPAAVALELVVKWKAGALGGRGGSGSAILSRDPGPGVGGPFASLCASAFCPSYCPVSGVVTLSGTVTPSAPGARPISCAASKRVESLSGAASGKIAFFKDGAKRLVALGDMVHQFALQSVGAAPECSVAFAPTFDGPQGSGAAVPFVAARLGGAKLPIAIRRSIAFAPAADQGGTVKGTYTIVASAVLARCVAGAC